MERSATLLPTPIILPPMMVGVSVEEPRAGLDGDSPWSADAGFCCVSLPGVPGAVPVWAPPGNWLALAPSCGRFAPARADAGVPSWVPPAAERLIVCGGLRLPMSWPEGPKIGRAHV